MEGARDADKLCINLDELNITDSNLKREITSLGDGKDGQIAVQKESEVKDLDDTCSRESNHNIRYKKVPLDVNLLPQLEVEANRIATSVDGLTENLSGLLHSISALTVECLDTYRNSICKTCDQIDFDIKLMYQLMAKCEELGKVAEPLSTLSTQIRSIKRVLDLLESAVNS